MDIQVWDAEDPDGRRAWLACWKTWPEREVFGHPDYLKLYARPGMRALCAAAALGDSYVLYPFLLRDLEQEPYCDPSLGAATDITTAYGYGGPFRWGTPWSASGASEFWRAFDQWAGLSHVVSEVVRMSLFPESLLPYAGEQHMLLDNVVCSLKDEDELWRGFEYKVRKNVNRARACGAIVEMDENGERLDDFLRIYTGTMDRRGQSSYFPRAYFERLNRDLRGQFAYFHVLAGGQVISTELVLISATRIYSFLGGTDAAWFPARPNELLKFEIMRWARAEGKTAFVLGGGNARSDGIYRYKLAFDPRGTRPFAIGSRVFSAETYVRLIAMRRALSARLGMPWQPKPEFFPAYRA